MMRTNSTSSAGPVPVLVLTLAVAWVICWGGNTRAQVIPIEEKNTICIVGDAVAEGMMDHPFFEVLLHTRFTEARLTFRNLARAGDTVFSQPRQPGEPGLDDLLSHYKADVICAFFGQTEAAAGKTAIPRFTAALRKWVKHVRSQKYNGTKPPILILATPPPFEATGDARHANTMRTWNENLSLYAPAILKVAQENECGSVDLFAQLTPEFLKSKSAKFTVDGVNLSREGYKLLSGYLDYFCFGRHPNTELTTAEARVILDALIELNSILWRRNRLPGVAYAYGRHADKSYSGVSNRSVLARELEQLDVLAVNRDKQIWSFAQRRKLTGPPDDSNVPKALDVKSTAKEPAISSSDKVLSSFKVAEGFSISLVASEAEIPQLQNPTGISFDRKDGSLLVTVAPSFPQALPGETPNDKVLKLGKPEDGGEITSASVLAENLYLPTGIASTNEDVFVLQLGSLVRLSDNAHVMKGLSSDTNALTTAADGGLLLSQGPSPSHVNAWNGITSLAGAGVIRFEPRSGKVVPLESHTFKNAPLVASDHWGQTFLADPGGDTLYSVPSAGLAGMPEQDPLSAVGVRIAGSAARGSTFAPTNWPAPFADSWLLCTQNKILAVTISDGPSGYSVGSATTLLECSDASFLPSDLRAGPDGALYIVDFCDPLRATGGLTSHAFRDPARDKSHGRIWKISAANKSETPASRDRSNIAKLWEQLQSGSPDPKLLKEALASKNPKVRAAAIRVIRAGFGAIPGAAQMILDAEDDPDRNVLIALVFASESLPDAIRKSLLLSIGPEL